jgi:hypothetical protein
MGRREGSALRQRKPTELVVRFKRMAGRASAALQSGGSGSKPHSGEMRLGKSSLRYGCVTWQESSVVGRGVGTGTLLAGVLYDVRFSLGLLKFLRLTPLSPLGTVEQVLPVLDGLLQGDRFASAAGLCTGHAVAAVALYTT